MGFVPKVKVGSSYVTSKILPHIQGVDDAEPGIKNIEIEGTRGDGSLIIPGGRESQDIIIDGIILASDSSLPDGTAYSNPNGTNYEKIMEQIDWLRINVPTTETHLYVEKTSSTYDDYVVRRIGKIIFPKNLRRNIQEYTITFRRM